MKVLIAGSSGFVGSVLVSLLKKNGHQVIRLLHGKSDDQGGDSFYWDPGKGDFDPKILEGCDAVINLAGENIAGGRWTEAKKRAILDSRVKSTHLLCEGMKMVEHPPKVLLNASAIGYYGTQLEEPATESTPLGEGFLAEVCRRWEEAASAAQQIGVRTVFVRTGVVLDPHGGALAKMLPLFKLGVGGVLGSGKQIMSWITLEDLVQVYLFCLTESAMAGPINAVSPNPVTNREFTKVLGKVLKRPTLFSTPAFFLKLIFGEMAEELLLSGIAVKPEKLLNAGFSFNDPDLEAALMKMLGARL